MRLQFNGNQPYQIRAIEAVADLFQGQPKLSVDYGKFALGQALSPVANRLDIDPRQLLSNLREVQARNGIKLDDSLQSIEDHIHTATGRQHISFPNYSVEMETGTGKTYVYIRTALELNRRYGLRKFIIVVPSVAIREGVLKTLKVTQDHLRNIYDNVPYRFGIYDSKSITKIRQFATADCVELLIMTIDSFNKDENVIRQKLDRLNGATPIHLVQTSRPILILDEPQNMESEGRIKALASLHPLFALRYSATHRNPYSLVYRLTPFEAYRQGLVKKLEVASVIKEDDFNQVFLRIEQIRSNKTTVQAKIAVHQRMANGTIKEKSYLFEAGDCLQEKADRSEYSSFIIDEIDLTEQSVRFRNGISLSVGQTQGADQDAIFREQIRYTIEEHFRKQQKLRAAGIKVLSLFFIDKVENYVGEPPRERGAVSVDGLFPGIIRVLFDEAFDELKGRYPEFSGMSAQSARSAYFAQKKRRSGEVELVNSTTGQSVEDRAAYDLIMKDKEQLLSFSEHVSFIFSHSALREGWDNPNVCQICTLNQTVSEVKKRQEVGRGMRLVVNQAGQRVSEPQSNILTVVANESYEQFVATLQAEMEEAFGKSGVPPRPANARQKLTVTRKPLPDLPDEFVQLWERIKHKTRYQVTVNTQQLVDDVLKGLDTLRIDPPRIVAEKAVVEAENEKERLTANFVGKGLLKTLTGKQPVPNLIEMIEDLLGHVSPPIRLTRRTLAEIITRTKIRQAALDNPQEFASQASRVIRQKAIQQLIDGIRYYKDGTWWDMSEWVEQVESVADRLVQVTKSIYDHITVESNTERSFVEKLKARQDVRLFVKLPGWFKVATPVGQYNPDWALVMDQLNAFGDDGPRLYLVRETKGSTVAEDLRINENRKIQCGERHFTGALGVDFRVVTNADDLP